MTVRIMIGDALSQLAELPDESVHCVMTSPPYWGLRAYKGDTWDGGNPACDHQRSAGDISTSTLGGGKATVNHAREGWPRGICGKCGATMTGRMIGLEPTFDAHLENLVAVFREVRRVLRSDGTLWLNYGDAYCGSGKGYWEKNKNKRNGNKGNPHSSDGHKVNASITGIKPKDLMMMPARVAMALQADGWWLRSEIIWHKSNPMPESTRDRPTSAHEKVFLLSKSARYFYDAEAVRTPSTGVPKMPDNWDTGPGAHGSVHRTGREKGKKRGHERRHDGFNDRWDAMTKDEQQSGGANIRNVWTSDEDQFQQFLRWKDERSGAMTDTWKISTHSFSEAHFATFPPALVEPCIKAGTSTHGVCERCGAPWVRDVNKVLVTDGDRKAMAMRNDGDPSDAGRNRLNDGHLPGSQRTETTGWSPSCQCKVRPTVPATCLDPFAGAGTVGIVADRLQRDAILIEISPDYAKMAQRRIEADAGGLFSSVVVG